MPTPARGYWPERSEPGMATAAHATASVPGNLQETFALAAVCAVTPTSEPWLGAVARSGPCRMTKCRTQSPPLSDGVSA
jgi:hypothetical protein